LTGALIGLGIPEYEAKRYEGKVLSVGILISVHTEDSDEARRAREIFAQQNAEDIASADEEATAGPAGAKLTTDDD